jgi:hypothetical protein
MVSVSLGAHPAAAAAAGPADDVKQGRPPSDPIGMSRHIWYEFEHATPHGSYFGQYSDTKRKLVSRWSGKLGKKAESSKDLR